MCLLIICLVLEGRHFSCELATPQVAVPRWYPRSSVGKESTCNAGDPGSIPGSGRSLEAGNSNPLQYSCLENTMDRGAWQATVHGIAKSETQLSH